MDEKYDFTISTIGKPNIPSPVTLSKNRGDYIANYVTDNQRVLYTIEVDSSKLDCHFSPQECMERAGPRERIYFDPSKVNAGVVTCGGLCPGLNDVIRAVIMCLWYRYGVRRICGIRFGYRGFLPQFKIPPIDLNPSIAEDIHQKGGTILGSSRGYGDLVSEIVDSIERMNLNILFAIGGDGTQRGALKIAEEAERRGFKLAVVGVPKTIDNDFSFVQRSFGFDTAVTEAEKVVSAAHVEAHDAPNGISIVKVMGRESGFIAAHTTLAINDVNFVLIPEVPFDLDGENGLLNHLQKRLELRNHAVILVAEGAGTDLMPDSGKVDASGNRKLGDIGLFLKGKIAGYFKKKDMPVTIRYIDPSYIIRSSPANSSDSLYCARLGNNAVHAAMAGKTKMIISMVNNHFVYIPTRISVSTRNHVDPESSLWRDVIEATGQPALMKNPR
ncbi:MAG: ATP-dependent 6-phosphofructokinase [Chitinivibrionales bacterium]|nr:ATP-dependent 6-phosphofructokinase [Chitinivibrionales bacterium]